MYAIFMSAHPNAIYLRRVYGAFWTGLLQSLDVSNVLLNQQFITTKAGYLIKFELNFLFHSTNGFCYCLIVVPHTDYIVSSARLAMHDARHAVKGIFF